MQITWFLSSLYLVSLYATLFYGPRRRSLAEGVVCAAIGRSPRREQVRRWPALAFAVTASGWLRAALGLGQWALLWYGNAYGLFFFDALWLESGYAQQLSYY